MTKLRKEITNLVEQVVARLKIHGVAVIDMTGKDSIVSIPSYLNADILVSNDTRFRLVIDYDGWEIILTPSRDLNNYFGAEINYRKTDAAYYAQVADDIVEAVLAFTNHHVAAVIHYEPDLPMAAQLYERTSHGYEYVVTDYTNPWGRGFQQRDGKKPIIEPRCIKTEVWFDDQPIPKERMSSKARDIFEAKELRSTLEIQKNVKDLHEIKPINQEVVLMDY